MAAEENWAGLRQMLVEEYEDLRKRLAARLGADEAREALQDTFLQLAKDHAETGPIRNPKGYLYRMAMNLANSRHRTERRRLDILDAQSLELALEIADDGPGPEEVAQNHSDIRLLRKLLEAMPPRRREMVLAVLVHGATHRELADRYKLSMRMIQIEMKTATDQIAGQFGGAEIIHFASRQPGTSNQ